MLDVEKDFILKYLSFIIEKKTNSSKKLKEKQMSEMVKNACCKKYFVVLKIVLFKTIEKKSVWLFSG